MANIFTNFSLPCSHTQKDKAGQTYQVCDRKPSWALQHLTKMKEVTVILFALILISVDSVIANPPANMTAGSYALTGSLTWYDQGGSGGTTCPGASAFNYLNSQNITETITANAGQQIVVAWTAGTFGIAGGDFLYVYDGPTTASPLLATYTNTANPIPVNIGATSGNSITFLFTSDGSNTCKGWAATITPYYFMQPGSYSFSCPGTYTFLDPQNPTSGGPGGDATCQFSGGSSKDYQDNILNPIETFSTSNGQCIQFDASFPSSFGLCAGDTLKVFDGPSIFSPIANSGTAVYTDQGLAASATPAAPSTFSTLGSSATFEFYADGSNHARGWQINLSCVNCPSASINNDCANAITLSPTNTCVPYASSTSAGNSMQSGVPACTGTANDDVWYKFTANNSTMSMTVAPTDGSMDPVIQLLSGTCITFTSLYCVNLYGAGVAETINATGLTVGTTYYIRVYDYTANAVAHTFNICVVGAAPTDCVGAVHICSSNAINGSFTANAYGTEEWTNGSWGCILFGETTSLWQYWQCQTSGTLEFTISSSNGTFQDVDWALWEQSSASMACPMNAQPIRCSYATGFATNSFGLPAYSTGCNVGNTDDVTESAGNCCGAHFAFVNSVNMVAGRYYILMMNWFSGNLSYQLTFNLTNGATFNNCILPIQLITFNGESLGTVNRIYWNTQSEVNNDHFVLEHSPDGTDFSELASINATGSSAAPSNYDYYDKHPYNGINYYRLKQVDADGEFTYSNIISLERYADLDASLTINPNPTAGIFNVGLSSKEDCKVDIQVFNSVGQMVQSLQTEMHPGQNDFPVDVTQFDRGIYTVKIRACDIGKVFTRKIVKM